MGIVHVGLTIDQMAAEVDRLEAENRGLVEDLRIARNATAAAEEQRDTARAEFSYYQRHFAQRTGR